MTGPLHNIIISMASPCSRLLSVLDLYNSLLPGSPSKKACREKVKATQATQDWLVWLIYFLSLSKNMALRMTRWHHIDQESCKHQFIHNFLLVITAQHSLFSIGGNIVLHSGLVTLLRRWDLHDLMTPRAMPVSSPWWVLRGLTRDNLGSCKLGFGPWSTHLMTDPVKIIWLHKPLKFTKRIKS